mmetsp:Transcript_6254/g.16988  ORF Transcript_6254/g.16988 Transcript_6254/m.16988 type:complete len:94 (-) Transcript_6254:1109-1390(-)
MSQAMTSILIAYDASDATREDCTVSCTNTEMDGIHTTNGTVPLFRIGQERDGPPRLVSFLFFTIFVLIIVLVVIFVLFVVRTLFRRRRRWCWL